MLIQAYNQAERGSTQISYSDFLQRVETGSVYQVIIQGDNISGRSSNGSFKTFKPEDPELIKLLNSRC